VPAWGRARLNVGEASSCCGGGGFNLWKNWKICMQNRPLSFIFRSENALHLNVENLDLTVVLTAAVYYTFLGFSVIFTLGML
jgi:hypothetical protein